MKLVKYLGCTLYFTLSTGLALAQNTMPSGMVLDTATNMLHSTLQETVVTGLAKPVKLQNALAQYRVITKAAMRAQGALNVAEALNTQLNINVNTDAVLGSNTSMQGLGGDKLKILIDGLPVNGRENGNIDLGQLSLNNVARIEIVQGPMSVLYGSDALGGVINIITERATKKNQLSAGVNYETVGKYNLDLAGNFTINKRNHLSAGLGRNFSDAYGYTDTLNPIRARQFKPKEQWLGNFKYQYDAASGIGITLASDLVKETITNRGSVIGWPYMANAVDEYYRTNRANNRLAINGKVGKNGAWRLDNGYAYYQRTRESQLIDLTTLTESRDTASGMQDTSRFDDITLRSNYANSYKQFHFDGGYDILLQSGKSGKFGGLNHNTQNLALYGNFAAKLLQEKLTLQLGLRGAYNSESAAPFIYSVNALYHPKESLQFRASYAKGFRTPSLKEKYLEFIDQNHHVVGNPNLKPEYGNHYQASASWQYPSTSAIKGGLTFTAFYNDVHDEISLANPTNDPGSIDRIYANIAHQKNGILNLQTEGEWHRIYVLLGGGLMHVLAADSGYNSFNVPEANATLRYSLQEARLNFSIFYKYTGKARQLSAMPDGLALYDVELPAFHMLDASVNRRFFDRKLDLTVGLKNIFNVTELTPTGGIGSGVHSSGGTSFLPRRAFVSMRYTL
ncbi:MAG: TonB-dependent receptor [Bacteroidetes bacterium]|nr:TonB-dependent receptor [Bacteroidota bacterium]